MTAALNLKHRLMFFSCIGGLSTLVHLSLVYTFVTYGAIPALIANIFAYLIAFNVSFLGHRYLTFSQLPDEKKLSWPHFFMVSASGGLMNEGLYFLLLRYTSLNYMVALIFVIGLIAVYSFVLSRFWACR